MHHIISDRTTGSLLVYGTFSQEASPTFSVPGETYAHSLVYLENVERLKTFTYSASGISETRYLYPEYRLSRDSNVWTPWQPLRDTIDNYPPTNPFDRMFLDFRFTRQGQSEANLITLNGWTFSGAVSRTVLDGSGTITLSQDNPSVIIKPPYVYKAFKLNATEVLSNGQIGVDFTIKWRYSQDYGRTVTRWERFADDTVSSAVITPIRFFQVEYLVERLDGARANLRIYDINLIGDFQNVTLDYNRTNVYGVRENCNSLMAQIVGDPETCPTGASGPIGGTSLPPVEQHGSVLPITTPEQLASFYKPYDLTAATKLLDKLSTDANHIFGHEVVYFLTDPDNNGIDYTFHEYQLYNYVSNCTIKVSVPNNEFPENNGSINMFDLMLFDTFEIHIPKKTFKEAFGPEKRPSKEDFLWFCNINKMFSIEHAQPFRGFNNNAIYYKVILKKYNQSAAMRPANATIEQTLASLTRNSTIDELFGPQNEWDKQSTANKEQQDILSMDRLRSEIFCDIQIATIYNSTTVVSTHRYDLSTVAFGAGVPADAVLWRGTKKTFASSDNIGYSIWFNINNWAINDDYVLFDYRDTASGQGLLFNITNGELRIQAVANGATVLKTVALPGNELSEGTWYCALINIDQRQEQYSAYVYKRPGLDENDAQNLAEPELDQVAFGSGDWAPVSFAIDSGSAKLVGCDMLATNIRFLLDVVPLDEHVKFLNRLNIGNDNRHTLFADNANRRIDLGNFVPD